MKRQVEYRWLIWSMKHRAWWADNRSGFVKLSSDAGRYSFDEACAIVRDANWDHECQDRPCEAMIPGEPILAK